MLNEFRDPSRGRKRDTPESTSVPRREKIHPDKPPYGSEGHSGPPPELSEPSLLKVLAGEIVNHFVDGVYVATGDGLISDANPALLSLLGANSLSAVRGSSIQSFLAPLPDQRVGQLTGVFKLRALDGSEPTVRHYTTEVPYVAGETRLIGFVREVRGVFDKHMLHHQRLANFGTMSTNVIHDMNNVLLPIVGYAEALELDLRDTPSNRNLLKRILKAGWRAHEIAELVRKHVSSADCDGTVRMVNLNEEIEETAELLDIMRPRAARIKYELSEDLYGVRGEPVQLRRIIMNLILNAWEALNKQPGVVTVRTSNTRSAANWPVSAGRAASYVLFEVSDTGCGMDEATRRRIFEPFFTSKNLGQGLGLATIAEILRMHRGSIAVESEPGKGSTFRTYLPAVV